MITIEYIYWWLSQIEEFHYLIYLKLMQIFADELDFFECTKQKHLFYQKLHFAEVNISQTLFHQLTNFSLKQKAYESYQTLKSGNQAIIHIAHPLYPKKLLGLYNAPLCLLVEGNIQLLKRRCAYIEKNSVVSKYGKFVYQMLMRHCRELGACVIVLQNHFDIKGKAQEISVCLDEKQMKSLAVSLTISFPNMRISMYSLEIIAALADVIVIPEARYEKENMARMMVECALECHTEILVVPGNIYDKNCYFSNHLLKEGANILTNKHDLDYYLKKG